MEPTTATPQAQSPRERSASAYVLVILRSGENESEYGAFDVAHRAFIEDLIEDNRILLGGAFAAIAGDLEAAYVLRVDSTSEARAIANSDPFVANGVCRADCREWNLVGINPEAIDEAVVVRPTEIS